MRKGSQSGIGSEADDRLQECVAGAAETSVGRFLDRL
jgi:hypothetical protein